MKVGKETDIRFVIFRQETFSNELRLEALKEKTMKSLTLSSNSLAENIILHSVPLSPCTQGLDNIVWKLCGIFQLNRFKDFLKHYILIINLPLPLI